MVFRNISTPIPHVVYVLSDQSCLLRIQSKCIEPSVTECTENVADPTILSAFVAQNGIFTAPDMKLVYTLNHSIT